MRLRSCCLTSRSLARMRLRIVVRRTMNRPNPFFPLMGWDGSKHFLPAPWFRLAGSSSLTPNGCCLKVTKPVTPRGYTLRIWMGASRAPLRPKDTV